MTSVEKPRGLIRYTSREALAGATRHLFRPRTVIYPVVLSVALGAFIFQLGNKAAADVTLLRATDAPFRVEADGRISNQVRIRIANRSNGARLYSLAIAGAESGQIIIPVNPFPVDQGATETTSAFVILPESAFTNGQRDIEVTIDDGQGFSQAYPYSLLGPTAHVTPGGSLR